jgi:catechol 2,3-dioxygenase-like lactoylglutathione lyase family enzyme
MKRSVEWMKEANMLQNRNAVANIAVRDMQIARKFYEGTLGLERASTEGEELTAYKSGDTAINVYRSRYAGTNQATAVTWMVGDDFDDIMRSLKAKGVMFEHYDMSGMNFEGDVHVAGDMKIAWFKDPDGNILNLVNG